MGTKESKRVRSTEQVEQERERQGVGGWREKQSLIRMRG